MALGLDAITELRTSTVDKDPSSPRSHINRVISFAENSPGPSNKSPISMSAAESPTKTGLCLPSNDDSPPDIERASTHSTITPLTAKMAIHAGSDGDDEKSPTVARVMQIPRKSVGSGISKTVVTKDTSQAQESVFGGGDVTFKALFRKKDGKVKDSGSGSAKGKAAEQDEGQENAVALKVSCHWS